jgi:hypothetical protein
MNSGLFIKRCLTGAGMSFLGMTGICLLLYPEILRHYEYGVSYFGSVSATAIPYYLGFGITILLTALAGQKLMAVNRLLGWFFYVFAACMTGVAATSYTLNSDVYAAHWGFVIALTLCLLAAIAWLVKHGGLQWLDYALMGLLVVTIVISVLPIVHHIPVVRIYILRELAGFICALWLLGRAAVTAAGRAA